MPGLVVAVAVEVGQEIDEGDVLVVLESMKMENELKAPREGVVSQVRVERGQRVEQNQTLLAIT
jgi:biotin carboxyl carrier protein